MDFYVYQIAKEIQNNLTYMKVYFEEIPAGGENLTPFVILKNFAEPPAERTTMGGHHWHVNLSFDAEIWMKDIVLDVTNPFTSHLRHQEAVRVKRLLLDFEDFAPWAIKINSEPGNTTIRKEGKFRVTNLPIIIKLKTNEDAGLTTEQEYFDTERFDLDSDDS